MTHQVQRDGVMTFIKEVDINQIWLLGHSPWVNANKKPNGKWINNITKEGPFLICVGGFSVGVVYIALDSDKFNPAQI